ncbi:MAG TPA: hypothetical protein VFC91_00105 [Atribacterota bacterium]|nr:hypothetical protein [Atribacterota bacterium]
MINTKPNISLKKFTYDYPDKTLSEKKFLNSPELISRILKYGNIYEWVWITHKLNKKGIKNFLKTSGYKLDDRTFNWWRIYCGFNDTFQKANRGIGNIKEIRPTK